MWMFVFSTCFVEAPTPLQCCLIVSWTSYLKHIVLRALLEDCLQEVLSKVCVFGWEAIRKSEAHRAIARAAFGDCGDLVPGSRILHPGPWIHDPGSRILDPGSWIQDPASWLKDPESRILDPRVRILDPGSWILDHGSRVLDHGS